MGASYEVRIEVTNVPADKEDEIIAIIEENVDSLDDLDVISTIANPKILAKTLRQSATVLQLPRKLIKT